MAADTDDETRLERLFENQAAQGFHHGAQLAVYHEGEQVQDLTTGETGPDGQPVTSDQRFVLFSMTKPLTGACIHQLVEAGELAYDTPIVEYWPEFDRGDEGKAAVTVRHVLSHQAGVPVGEFDLRPNEWTDWDAAVDAMEEISLQFEPGTAGAYHLMNYGWILGELVRRVTGTTIGQYLRTNVLDPLGMTDTYLGLPPEIDDDVATLVGFEPFDRCRDPNPERSLNTADSAARFNREDFHQAEMPAGNAVGTASDIARFYACLLNGGELDGTHLLEPETIAEATSVQIDVEEDLVRGIPVRYALGFARAGTHVDKYGTLAPPSTFGHGGLRSSVGWADPEVDLAFCAVTNGIRDRYEHQLRMNELSDAVRRVYT